MEKQLSKMDDTNSVRPRNSVNFLEMSDLDDVNKLLKLLQKKRGEVLPKKIFNCTASKDTREAIKFPNVYKKNLKELQKQQQQQDQQEQEYDCEEQQLQQNLQEELQQQSIQEKHDQEDLQQGLEKELLQQQQINIENELRKSNKNQRRLENQENREKSLRRKLLEAYEYSRRAMQQQRQEKNIFHPTVSSTPNSQDLQMLADNISLCSAISINSQVNSNRADVGIENDQRQEISNEKINNVIDDNEMTGIQNIDSLKRDKVNQTNSKSLVPNKTLKNISNSSKLCLTLVRQKSSNINVNNNGLLQVGISDKTISNQENKGNNISKVSKTTTNINTVDKQTEISQNFLQQQQQQQNKDQELNTDNVVNGNENLFVSNINNNKTNSSEIIKNKNSDIKPKPNLNSNAEQRIIAFIDLVSQDDDDGDVVSHFHLEDENCIEIEKNSEKENFKSLSMSDNNSLNAIKNNENKNSKTSTFRKTDLHEILNNDSNITPNWLIDAIQTKKRESVWKQNQNKQRKPKTNRNRSKAQNKIDPVKEDFINATRKFLEKPRSTITNNKRMLYTRGKSAESECEAKQGKQSEFDKQQQRSVTAVNNSAEKESNQNLIINEVSSEPLDNVPIISDRLQSKNENEKQEINKICPKIIQIKLKRLNHKKINVNKTKEIINAKLNKNSTSHTSNKKNNKNVLRTNKKAPQKANNMLTDNVNIENTENNGNLRRSKRQRSRKIAYWENNKHDVEETELFRNFIRHFDDRKVIKTRKLPPIYEEKQEDEQQNQQNKLKNSKQKRRKNEKKNRNKENEEILCNKGGSKKCNKKVSRVLSGEEGEQVQEQQQTLIENVISNESIISNQNNILMITNNLLIENENRNESENQNENENRNVNERRNINENENRNVNENVNQNKKKQVEKDKEQSVKITKKTQTTAITKRKSSPDSGNMSDIDNEQLKPPAEKKKQFHWLNDLLNRNLNNNEFSEQVQIIQTGNVTKVGFEDLQFIKSGNIEYAYYEKNMGYIKIKPFSEKKISKTGCNKLKYVVITGDLDFHIGNNIVNGKDGDHIKIGQGTKYKIKNNINDTALLLFTVL